MFFKRRGKTKPDKVLAVSEENMQKCLCTECPTNPDNSTLYCAKGPTTKPIEQIRALGCSCALCPVFHEHNLSGCYICLTKPNQTQTKQNETN